MTMAPASELPEDSLGLTGERFGFGMFMSICVHAMIILGVGFTVATQPEVTTSLDITIASFESEQAPEDADFLAQANQEGSGTEDEKLAPATDVQARYSDDVIRDVEEFIAERPATLPEETRRIIARSGDQAPAVAEEPETPVEDAEIREETSPDAGNDSLASLRAQLDLHREAYAKRPRRYTITSASTRQANDALYLDNWRKRIEAIGNLNYPEQASAQGIYGTLRMMVAINPDGSVHDIRILRSSGESVLDEAAVRIVQLAAPFDPFPPEMRREVDILEIIRTWQFHRGDRFSSF